jgi:hypothetical protein
MFELLEIELTRVRKMAEQAGDAFLLYLIDIAIIEAHAQARTTAESPETALAPSPVDLGFAPKTASELEVVR